MNDIKRAWHLIDIKGKVLGRTATQIASSLMGKDKPYYARNQDVGDYVIVINARETTVTGKKETKKKYYRHSGYPGGLKVEVLGKLRQRKPEDIIIHAVKGMLPQNKLRDLMLKRLFVFPGEKHPYQEKFKTPFGPSSFREFTPRSSGRGQNSNVKTE